MSVNLKQFSNIKMRFFLTEKKVIADSFFDSLATNISMFKVFNKNQEVI